MSDEDKEREADDAPPGEVEPAEAPAPRAKKSARVVEDEDDADEAPRPAAPAYRPPLAFFVIASVLSLAADLGSKLWAEGALEQGDVVVIDGLMHFDLAHNPGGAFGLLGKMDLSVRRPLFVAISVLAVVFIVSLFRRLEARQTALRWALPLVLGGAIGNLVDRIRYGYVIDFIDVFAKIDGKIKHWPTFNVADIWIVAGVILIGIDMFTSQKAANAPKAASGSSTPPQSKEA